MARTAIFLIVCIACSAVSAVDLSRAKIIIASGFTAPAPKAALLLADEAEKRTGLRWPILANASPPAEPLIILTTADRIDFLPENIRPPKTSAATQKADGYSIFVSGQSVVVIGNDPRGLLFGAGRLLRELQLRPGRIELADNVAIQTAPQYPLRGHQLGYRPKTNSYDAWDLPQWEQYIRDLVVFGCNAIELIPPRSDDAADSPHFHRPPFEMMVGMSRIAAEYGLAVWIWYPAMDPDYSRPDTVRHALEEWAKIFEALPKIDAVFVPGGDPGHTRPKFLMALLEKQTASLHRFHPHAQMWVSPQGFTGEWMSEFLQILRGQKPGWLSGVVYGPQVRGTLRELRSAVPEKYPIRHYPDITHSRQCEYPVPEWDIAFAVTEARECINPRPLSEAAIFNATLPDTIGFLTYSEGCNDDVNKFVWSSLGWDPSVPVIEILREYGRYFIGPEHADDFAQGLLALEQNWAGPLLANQNVEQTLAKFQSLERHAPPRLLRNWRFQQALFRAYYDAYERSRLIHETDLENRALEILRDAASRGSIAAVREADNVLDSDGRVKVAGDLRQRVFELGEALFQSIGMQLSVEKYQAIAVDRGACLDTIDFPLNDRVWLKDQFRQIRAEPNETARLRRIEQVLNWTNPGPGGFYDDLGHPGRQPHLVRPVAFDADPGGFVLPRADFEEDLALEPGDPIPQPRRVSWMDHMEVVYDGPLKMRYSQLDPSAQYELRVVYAGDTVRKKIRLVANESAPAGPIQIHPYLQRPFPFERLSFDIPRDATKTGQLELSWYGEPGLGGNGRACQVSEVWLVKKQ